MHASVHIQYTRCKYMRLETQDSCIIIVEYLFVFANKSYDPIHPGNGSLWISGYSNVCPVKMIMCRHFKKCGQTHTYKNTTYTNKSGAMITIGLKFNWNSCNMPQEKNTHAIRVLFFNHFKEIQIKSYKFVQMVFRCR